MDSSLIIPVVVVAILLLLIITIPLWYIKSPPDKAFIITGLGKRKVIIGKSGVKIPFLQRLDKLSLEMMSVDVKTDSFVPTNDYINVKIDGAVKIKIGDVPELTDRVFDTCFDIKHHQKLKTALFFCQILKYFMLYGVVLLFKV